ncbi:hypothetical protein [Desulfovibrio inopinatus]|uniref:hypothetical protein n=1 Tax=Desulfovibrio inopinatus TaxID=102109 RepID=UPI0004888C4E|nr:hypothetical protein [Desulfovibrio inopinatus]
MSKAIWCLLILGLVSLAGVAWNAPAWATMDMKAFHERCIMQVGDDCTSMCGSFEEAVSVDVTTLEQCRAKCNSLAESLRTNDAVSDCSGSIGTAMDLCLEYCQSNH